MHRALVSTISLLVASGSAVADEAAAPRTRVVGEKRRAGPHSAARQRSRRAKCRCPACRCSATTTRRNRWRSCRGRPRCSATRRASRSCSMTPAQPVDKDVFMRELAYYEIKDRSK